MCRNSRTSSSCTPRSTGSTWGSCSSPLISTLRRSFLRSSATPPRPPRAGRRRSARRAGASRPACFLALLPPPKTRSALRAHSREEETGAEPRLRCRRQLGSKCVQEITPSLLYHHLHLLINLLLLLSFSFLLLHHFTAAMALNPIATAMAPGSAAPSYAAASTQFALPADACIIFVSSAPAAAAAAASSNVPPPPSASQAGWRASSIVRKPFLPPP
mmetsp:Transcript_23502/g.76550  ORF Transcript_23502/g.76550 Transcript_23502/m.76550 type:complete len:217 (+) Transcript_23502:2321-2971(+)